MPELLPVFVFLKLAWKLEISVVKSKKGQWIGFQYRTLYLSYAEPADFIFYRKKHDDHFFSSNLV